MRAFIAIELSDQIKSTLSQVQSHLKYPELSPRDDTDVKWIEKDDIHLTLKFLGEIDEKKLQQVKNIIDETGKLSKPFEISLRDIGAFPNIDFPKVIWAGLDKGAMESAEIAKRIDDELSKLGFQPDIRPFAAHITIGRVRSQKNKGSLKQKIANHDPLSTIHGTVSFITLYDNTLTPAGPIYTKLHEAKLR